jgi:ParB family transcriptional regulator, chromosome partitioning protein
MLVFEKTTRLGKGLEALIPKTFLTSGKTVINIPLIEIQPNPYQPRASFSQEKIEKLAESIRKFGVNQPIIVRKKETYYELIAGERRYRACLAANLESVPAIIKEVSDIDSLQIALVENLEREDLNPIEEAKGYSRLAEEFGMTHQMIAESFGKSRSAITNLIRLLRLPEEVKDAILSGLITEGHARSLLSLENTEDILEKFYEIKEATINVRELEEFVSETKKAKTKRTNPDQLLLFSDLEEKLAERFSTKVKITGTEKSGKIVIPYKNKKQFSEICKKLELAIN